MLVVDRRPNLLSVGSVYGDLKVAFVERDLVGHLLATANTVWVVLGGQSPDSVSDVEQGSFLNAFV